jgi:hypothetical protein
MGEPYCWKGLKTVLFCPLDTMHSATLASFPPIGAAEAQVHEPVIAVANASLKRIFFMALFTAMKRVQ